MFFANEQRDNVREENPGISFGMLVILARDRYLPLTRFAGQVGKQLGERWKALNDKQRTPYEAKAAQDKKRYEDEKASYNVSDDGSSRRPKRPGRGTNKNVAQADAGEEEEEE